MAFLNIITDNILPLLIFVIIGYLLDRRFALDIQSVTKLTFFVVLPCFIFYSIYNANIDMALINVFLCGAITMFILWFIALIIGKIRNYTPGMVEAFRNATMFSNAANIGVALVTLIFTHAPYVKNGTTPYLPEALGAATMILVLMNLTLNTLGLYQAGKGKLTAADSLRVIFHMPVVYVLVCVFVIKWSGLDITGTFIWPVFENCANALVAIVMMALGMQIHKSRIILGDPDAWLACFARLILAPLIAFLLIAAWGQFSPVVSQVIFIMAAVPSAVNTVLYAAEFRNCVDFATETVMMSTFASAITLAVSIYLSQILFPL